MRKLLEKPYSAYHNLSAIWDRLKNSQAELAKKVKIIPLNKKIQYIGGCDCGISGENGIGVVTVVKLPDMDEVECQYIVDRIKLPYRTGYLGFREAPLLVKAFRKLNTVPDLLLVDGQGIAHPRSLGLASHLGILLDIPAIGCAKSRLIGDYQEPEESRGSYSKLIYKGKLIGYVLRTRSKVRCLFVSPGHLISFEESIDWVLKTSPQYRIPVPIRFSHHHAKIIRSGNDRNKRGNR